MAVPNPATTECIMASGPRQGEHWLHRKPSCLQSLLHNGASPGAFLPQDEWFPAELAGHNALLLQQGVARRRDGDQFVLMEYLGIQILRFDYSFGQPSLDDSVHQAALDVAGVGDLQLELDVRVSPMELAKRLRQEVSGNRRAGPDGQPPPPEAAKLLECPSGLAFQRIEPPRVFGEEFPGVR